MTVKELIEELRNYPEETKVSFSYQYGTDYGTADGEYDYTPTFKHYDGIGCLDIQLY